jgi:hypothetical protein
MKTDHILVLIVLIVSMLLTSCTGAASLPVAPLTDGEIIHIFSGTARYIAYTASIFKSGSWVLYNEAADAYIFIRALEDGIAFVAHRGGEIITDPYFFCGGNLVNCSTWNKFVNWLTAEGGFVPVTTVTPALEALALSIANFRPSMLLMVFSEETQIELPALERSIE